MRCYSKSELAELAGVSYSTLYRFLRSRRQQLTSLGCQPGAHLVRGKALDYICSEYGIDL